MSYGPAIIRTVTNFIVAWLLSLPLVSGLDVDSTVYQTLVTAIVGMVYYAVVHYLELHVSPKFSLLLASTKQPGTYVNENSAPVIRTR